VENGKAKVEPKFRTCWKDLILGHDDDNDYDNDDNEDDNDNDNNDNDNDRDDLNL
jgi:hypothetical protein